ncbi:MAG: TolC family protein [bacterium]|nr:TolC family protein [bacterium]
MKLTRLLIALLLAFAFGSSARSSDSLSIDQVVNQVTLANKRAETAKFMESSSSESASATGRWPDPMLMVGIQNTPRSFDLDMDPMTMRVIGLSQEIPYSGSRTLLRRAAIVTAQESASDRKTIQRELALAARLAFIDLYFKRELMAELLQQQLILRQIEQSTAVSVESGRASRDQLISAQSDLWRIESSIISLEQEIEAARLRLNSLRAESADAAVELTAPESGLELARELDVWIEDARTNYPPLEKLRFGAERYRIEASAANRMSWPMLSLSAEYGIRTGRETDLHGEPGEEREDMLSFSASISLPIFSRGTQKGMARSMQAMSAGRSAEAEQMWRDVESALRSLHQRLGRIDRSIALYQEKIIPASEEITKSLLTGYEANRVSLPEVLQSQISFHADRMTLINLLSEKARTSAEVLQYTDESPHRSDPEEKQ